MMKSNIRYKGREKKDKKQCQNAKAERKKDEKQHYNKNITTKTLQQKSHQSTKGGKKKDGK